MRFTTLLALLICYSSQPVLAQQSIKIGVAAPLSGDFAVLGSSIAKGAEGAAKKINDQGGINGLPVELIFADDSCSRDVAISAARNLVFQNEVSAVIGHSCFSAAAAAVEVYSKARIPFLSLSASRNPSGKDFNILIRFCGNFERQAEIMSSYVKDTYGDKKIGGVFSENAYGGPARDIFQTSLQFQYLPDGDGAQRIDEIVKGIQSENLDVIILYGIDPQISANVMRAAQQKGLKTEFVLDGFASDNDLLQIGSAVGAIYNTACFIPAFDEEIVSLASAYVDIGELGDVPGFGLQAAAALQVLAEAAKITGFNNTDAVISEIKSKEFDTPMGQLRFDADGNIVTSLGPEKLTEQLIYQWYMLSDNQRRRWSNTRRCK